METKVKKRWIELLCIPCVMLASVAGMAIEPTSSVTPSDDQYVVYNDLTDSVTFSTTEKPTPRCTSDQAKGDPTYYWDYGALDGDDSTPGKLTINSDTSGSAQISVYCEQDFTDAKGETYTEDTLTSN